METSPFEYTGPLPADKVVGRDDLVAGLLRRVTSRSPTALLGPRRYGKTSVLNRLEANLDAPEVVRIDLMYVQSPADAVHAITKALSSSPGVFRAATDITARVGLHLPGLLRADVRATRRPQQQPPETLFHTLVDTLVESSLRAPTVIVFDEFQQIGALDNGTAILRAALQQHYRDIGLVFAGSAPSAMRDIFGNAAQPFLHQAEVVTIGPLGLDAVHQLVTDGFAATGRDPGSVGHLVHQLTGGHPLRTMQAAHVAWQHTGEQPADRTWADALASLRNREHPALAAMYEQFSPSQRKTLRAVAHHQSPYGTAGDVLDLSKGGASSALRGLAADGHIVDTDGDGPAVTDPLLADWLRLHYPL